MDIERICIVFGTKDMVQRFLDSESWGGGMLGYIEDIELVELKSGTCWFNDIRRAINKGFEE